VLKWAIKGDKMGFSLGWPAQYFLPRSASGYLGWGREACTWAGQVARSIDFDEHDDEANDGGEDGGAGRK
jgi:hypothetical protein